MARKLTPKQIAFAKHYVVTGNGVEAAKLAGYSGSYSVLGVTAFDNLKHPKIATLIATIQRESEKRVEGKILTATETLVSITKIAEADIADVFPDDPFLQEAKRQGVSRLIKTINFDKDTGRITRLEMYSAQTAQQDMGKHHGLFPTKIEITSDQADSAILSAVKEHGLPVPGETFGGEPIIEQ